MVDVKAASFSMPVILTKPSTHASSSCLFGNNCDQNVSVARVNTSLPEAVNLKQARELVLVPGIVTDQLGYYWVSGACYFQGFKWA